MLRSVVRGHVYVGAVDEGRHLLQHQTQLYLVDTTACCEELFYQEALRRFAQIKSRLAIEKPLPLLPLLQQGLRQARAREAAANAAAAGAPAAAAAGASAAAGSAAAADAGGAAAAAAGGQDGARAGDEAEAQELVELLVGKAEMVDEYFAIGIRDEPAVLASLPVLMEQYEPHWGALPAFLYDLATGVDWTEEQPCFEGVARALGRFYAVQAPLPGQSAAAPASQAEEGDDAHSVALRKSVRAAMPQRSAKAGG